MLVSISERFLDQEKTGLAHPFSDLLQPGVVMISAFMRPFSVDDRESQLLPGNESVLDLLLAGDFNREIEIGVRLDGAIKIAKHAQPVFGEDHFHGVHAACAIEGFSITHFLYADFLYGHSGMLHPPVSKRGLDRI